MLYEAYDRFRSPEHTFFVAAASLETVFDWITSPILWFKSVVQISEYNLAWNIEDHWIAPWDLRPADFLVLHFRFIHQLLILSRSVWLLVVEGETRCEEG